MTLSSDGSQYNKTQFRKALQILNQIIEILAEFGENYDKKLNFSKLASLLKISHSEIDEIIYLLLNFQEKFERIFRNFHLKKKRENNQVYLVVEKNKRKSSIEIIIPNIIVLFANQLKFFNDIIYTFKYVKRGKGFDITKNSTELSINLKQLKAVHPYLFEVKENGLIYPSHFGLKLGDLIISYNKGNKKIEEIIIDTHTIKVIEDG